LAKQGIADTSKGFYTCQQRSNKTTMGNSAAKQLDETELVVGTIKEGDGRSIAKTVVTNTAGTTKIKSKNKTWIQYGDSGEEALLWSYKHFGTFKNHSTVTDATGKQIATIFTVKKGINSCTNFICRPEPSFDGQKPLTKEELEKGGIKGGQDYTLYKFAKYETTKKLTTAKCVYGLIKGNDDEIEALYEGERLSSLGFRAIFKEAGEDGAVVGKAYMPGLKMNPHLDVSSGVDMLAIVSMGYALAGDESSAGALAGAGVV